jgi:hypothetical protein
MCPLGHWEDWSLMLRLGGMMVVLLPLQPLLPAQGQARLAEPSSSSSTSSSTSNKNPC